MNIYVIAKSIDSTKGSEYRLAFLTLSNILKNNFKNYNIFLITPEFDNNINNISVSFSQYKTFNIIKVNFLTYGFLLHNSLTRGIIYKLWHYKVLFVLFKQYSKIDVIHHLNTINYNLFGHYFLLRKKFIWGPIDGGTYVRFNSYSNFAFLEKIKFGILNLFNQFNFYLNPFFRLNLLYADWVFSSTIDFKRKLLKISKFQKVLHLPDTGSDYLKLNIDEKILLVSNEKIVYTWMGQNIPRKNLSYLLNIISRLKSSDKYIFNIVGVDPKHFQSMDGVIFHGIVDFNKVNEILKRSHFLVSTSIRDSNTSSAFEAFDMLVPTICSSQIGFSDLIKIHGIGITYDFNISDELFNIFNKINLMDKEFFLCFYKAYLERIVAVSDILTYDFKSKVILDVYEK